MRDWLRNVWERIATPHPTVALGVLVGVGIVGGVMSLLAFDYSMHATSTDAFCLSCHELEVNIGIDYETRSHALNARGFRTTCADCHIPNEVVPKYMRKARAVMEVYHHLAGTIDTPEKFEAHRMTMATRVWRDMESNDSRECRNCHDTSTWDLAEQSPRAQEFHSTSMTRGKTCISCHKGVAHVLPQGVEADSPVEASVPAAEPTRVAQRRQEAS